MKKRMYSLIATLLGVLLAAEVAYVSFKFSKHVVIVDSRLVVLPGKSLVLRRGDDARPLNFVLQDVENEGMPVLYEIGDGAQIERNIGRRISREECKNLVGCVSVNDLHRGDISCHVRQWRIKNGALVITGSVFSKTAGLGIRFTASWAKPARLAAIAAELMGEATAPCFEGFVAGPTATSPNR